MTQDQEAIDLSHLPDGPMEHAAFALLTTPIRPCRDSGRSLEPIEPPHSRQGTIAGLSSFGGLSTRSEQMGAVFDVLGRLAKTDVTITLTGETGTGKDRLACTIHEQSDRADGPLVVFDCGSVPANLAESELLGHERGAFTGAHSAHAGAFQRAHKGTLFLDEVGELPLDLQPRLLRVLESRKVRRVGGSEDRPVDVRVIAATNRDLKADVNLGKFRKDLYFRLCAAVVHVPALRNRIDDVGLLVPKLLRDLGRPELEVVPAALSELKAHPWPGNVRELKNALACALAFVDGPLLEPRHLQFLAKPPEDSNLDRLPLAGQTLQAVERAVIKQTLAHAGGNKSHAARVLGIAVSTLYEKLKKYDLA